MKLTIDANELDLVIRRAVAESINAIVASIEKLDRVAYAEPQAAEMLGLQPHQLRDARLRGEIVGSKIGRTWTYSRGELVRLLEERRSDRDE